MTFDSGLFYTDAEFKTENLGYELGRILKGGAIVTLNGDLGSGKTVFARGIAKGMGITESITSPTFSLVQEYHGKEWTLYHIDLYRIHNEYDALAFGIEDFLSNDTAITVIEWAKRAQGVIGRVFYDVHLIYLNAEKRKINIGMVDPSHPANLAPGT